MEILKLILM